VTSIDAHPTKTWIVMGHEGGNFSIWDYQTQEIVMELQVNEVPGKLARRIHGIYQFIKETPIPHSVCSVKFIAQEKWLAVGDGEGYIYVYAYTDTHKLDKVTRFRAYRHKSVDSLAVHPTEPYLLSSSAFDRKIQLRDWSKGWEKFKEFDVKPKYEGGVRSVKFNPRDTNTFACVLYDKTVKVGNINSSNLKTTLKGASNADYCFTSNHQNLMVTLSFKSSNPEIRDLDTGKIVHTLGMSGLKTSRVACHQKLPILATTLDDGTICLWDASTYK
jgi:coatomer subunit beta'